MNSTFTPFLLFFCMFFSLAVKSQDLHDTEFTRAKYTILYFNPEIEPEVQEIKRATNEAFFIAVSDFYSNIYNTKMLRIQSPVQYETVNTADITESCLNNDAQFAIIPKVKFFKIGFGKYVLSSQVIVSMKLYDARGNMLSENAYDTFKKKARILGSAENSVRLGTTGVLKMMMKDFRKVRRNSSLSGKA